jgi:type I restriction enzyme S subunit
MAAVSEDGQIDFEEQREARQVKKGYTYFERGDVLIAKITPCFENGKAARTDTLAHAVGFGSTEFHVLRPNEEIDESYLFYLIWNSRFREVGASNMTGSAGQKRVPADFLKRLQIPLPPLDEQRRIAAILDKADALRRKRKRALQLLIDARIALIASHLRAASDIELGELITEGPTNGLYKPAAAYGQGQPILRINNFYDGEVVDQSMLRRLQLDETELKRFHLAVGDIVINRVNSLEYLGKSALIEELHEPTVYESNMMRLAVDNERMLPEVVIALLQTADVKRQILSKAKNAVNQSSINQSDVRSIRLPLPLMKSQRKFADAVRNLKTQRRRSRQSGYAIDILFASLQHRAFSGQL